MDKEQAIKLAQRYKAAVAERLPLNMAHTAKATIRRIVTLTLLL